MSFIVKGIDMPSKDKAPLQFTVWSDGTVYCRDAIEKIVTVKATQIPKDHGRIGDFDLLKDTIKDSVPAYGIGIKIPTYGDMDIMDKIGFMPTILEAESKEGISECSGCKYHELDPKEFPCYECRRNYYDKYEDEGYEEE